MNDVEILYDTVETKESRMKLIIHDVDEATLSLARVVQDMYMNHDWEYASQHLDVLKKFYDEIENLKKNKMITHRIQDWPLVAVVDSSLIFVRTKVSYF